MKVAPAEVVTDAAGLGVAVVVCALVVPVREDEVQHTGLGRSVKITRHIVGREGEFWRVFKRNSEGLRAFGVDGHVARHEVVEARGVHVLVAVVKEEHIGVLGHLVEDVRVVHQLGVSAAQLHRQHEAAEGFEKERFSRSSVALFVFAYLVVEGLSSPRPALALETVQHVADDKEFVE